MADGTIQIYPDSTGKILDTSSLTVGANTVQRQRWNVADPTAAAALAGVTAKAAQPGYALGVQELKDTGRVNVAYTAVGIAGVTSEALITLQPEREGVNGTTGTSFVASTNKQLRLTGLTLSVRAGAASATWTRFLIRQLNTGTTIVTSPILFVVEVGPQSATSGAVGSQNIAFPDGLEIAVNTSFGISHLSSATTNVESLVLNGFEY